MNGWPYSAIVSAIESRLGMRVVNMAEDYRNQRINVQFSDGQIHPFDSIEVEHWIRQAQSYMDNRYYMPPKTYMARSSMTYHATVPSIEEPKSCKSCAGSNCSDELDHHGWCKKTADAFWARAQKLRRHRQLAQN